MSEIRDMFNQLNSIAKNSNGRTLAAMKQMAEELDFTIAVYMLSDDNGGGSSAPPACACM